MIRKEIETKIKETIVNLFAEVGCFQSKPIFTQQNIWNYQISTIINTKVNGNSIKFFLEVKSYGEPRQIRATVQQLLEYRQRLQYTATSTDKQNEQTYGIIAVPYITEQSAQICKENNVGFIDLAGNCFIKFGQIFIERKNYPNLYKEKRIVKSIFTPKASRILRVMLSNPKREWQLQELSKESEVSLGQAYKVKERLFDLEYATENKKNIILKNPAELLSKWSDNYSFKNNMLYDCFSFGEPKEIEQNISNYCGKNNIAYALTLFSGLDLVAPYARYNRSFVYIKEKINDVVSALELKPVDSGPNVTILCPYDNGVFYGLQTIEGMNVTANVQLYLDLASYKGRGDESAKFLLEQNIKPQW